MLGKIHMNRRKFLLIASLLSFFLVNCSPVQPGGSPAEVQTLMRNIQALAAKDEATYSRLICPDWASEAFLEFDAYRGVESHLGEITCQRISGQGDEAKVTCQGKILLSYGNEKQEIDLASRIYQLKSNGGVWQVCGFTSIEK